MSTSSQRSEADSVVKNHVMMSMGAGLVPIPLMDIAAVTAVQMDMLKQLAWVYGVDEPVSLDKSLITTLTGSIFARLGASFVKAIPIVGSIIGGLSMAIMSGASTYAVGQVFIRHFAAGGTLSDFDPMKAKDYFQDEFERGKQQAERWKHENESRKTAPSNEAILDKLKALNELRQSGAITEEEYTSMKAKILQDW